MKRLLLFMLMATIVTGAFSQGVFKYRTNTRTGLPDLYYEQTGGGGTSDSSWVSIAADSIASVDGAAYVYFKNGIKLGTLPAITSDTHLVWSNDSVGYAITTAGSSNWDKSNDTITPIAGVDVVDIRTDTLTADGSLWFTDPHNASNVMIGDGAGATSATHGNDNIGIGKDALISIQSAGTDNIGIGTTAGNLLTTGDQNVLIGDGAGYSIVTNGSNVAIGYQSMNIASGIGNTALGHRTLASGNGLYNVAIGRESMESSGGGDYNVSIGYQAMENAATTGNSNIAMGREALHGINSGGTNIGIGAHALYTNISGSGNVALGYQAGYNETGSNKLYIENSNSATPLIYGDFNLDYLTFNGTVNINQASTDSLMGDGSLWFTDPHNADNVMIGPGVGTTSATHGNNNVGIGRFALKDLASGGAEIVSIGYNSGSNITSGDNNTSVGAFSLLTVTSQTNNSAFGFRSLGGASMSNSVGVGDWAGYSSGDNSVHIGSFAGANATGSGNLFAGYHAGENETGSNLLYIENSNSATPLIHGNFAADSIKIHGTFSTNNAIGEMYFSEADTISTATTSWYSPTKFTIGDAYGMSVVGDTGLVITQNGWYQVAASPSFEHSNTNVVIEHAIFVNGVQEPGIETDRTVGTGANQFGSASLSGLIRITDAPDTLQMKSKADKTGNLISNHNNVSAIRVR